MTNELQQLQLLRPTPAARLIGVHVKTLARWRRSGKGPTWYEVEGGAMYDRSELERWVHACRRGGDDV